MNALTRWDPFKEMDDMQSRFAKFLGLTAPRLGNGGKATKIAVCHDNSKWLETMLEPAPDSEQLVS
jgi:hypothetical protein